MSEEKEGKVTTFLIAEIATIQHAANHHDIYVFSNIQELTQVFLAFLRFPCNEPLVERVGSKVLRALSLFTEASLDPDVFIKCAGGFSNRI